MKTIQCILLALFSIFIFSCDSKEEIKPNEEVVPNDETEQTDDPQQDDDEDEQPTAEYLALIAHLLECMNMERPADSYNYPVRPGMEGWKELKTGMEMHEACQVPQEKLKKMSTQAVLQALWEYPLTMESTLMFSSSHQYQRVFQGFCFYNDAFNELIQRTDAGMALLTRLLLLNPLHPKVHYLPNMFELLMCQPPLLSQLNEEELKQLITITLKNDDLRGSYKEVHLYEFASWILIGKALKNTGYAPFIEEMNQNEQLQAFIEDMLYSYGRSIDTDIIAPIIIEHAQNYLAGN
jgi:hypothetical protein